MTVPATGDVIDVLINQHEQIMTAFAEIEMSAGAERVALLDKLVALVHEHEAGEQEVVHTTTRDKLGERGVAAARVAEEEYAESALSSLRNLGTEDPTFEARLVELRDTVLEHAKREELEEFPRLRAGLSGEQLRALGEQLRAAQAAAGG